MAAGVDTHQAGLGLPTNTNKQTLAQDERVDGGQDSPWPLALPSQAALTLQEIRQLGHFEHVVNRYNVVKMFS